MGFSGSNRGRLLVVGHWEIENNMRNPYHNALRQYCELQARRGLTGQYIRYQILPDEVLDHTLVSFRVYG